MNEEEPLTDEQQKAIASLGMKDGSGRRSFRHSPLLIFAIVLPLVAAAVLMLVLFIPMMICSGSSGCGRSEGRQQWSKLAPNKL